MSSFPASCSFSACCPDGTLKKAISARLGADGTLSRTAEHKPRSLCRTYRHLHQGAFSTFVHGSMPVTQDIALRLARSLNTTPGLWLNMQKSVALRIANHEKQGLTAPSGQVSLQGKPEKGEGRDGLFPATTGDCLGSEECEVGIVRGRAAKGNFGSSPKPPSAACTASIAICPWRRMEPYGVASSKEKRRQPCWQSPFFWKYLSRCRDIVLRLV